MAPAGFMNKRKTALIAAAALAGGLLNCLGSTLNIALGSPLFLDSIFTAASGALFGPWMACLCALATHASLVCLHGWDLQWACFLPCSLATGLISALFAGKRKPASLYAIILCSFFVALANALIGGTIAAFAFGGITTHTSDYLVTGLLLAGQSMLSASFLARVPLNLIDKGIAVGLAFILYSRPGLRAFFGLDPLADSEG